MSSVDGRVGGGWIQMFDRPTWFLFYSSSNFLLLFCLVAISITKREYQSLQLLLLNFLFLPSVLCFCSLYFTHCILSLDASVLIIVISSGWIDSYYKKSFFISSSIFLQSIFCLTVAQHLSSLGYYWHSISYSIPLSLTYSSKMYLLSTTCNWVMFFCLFLCF